MNEATENENFRKEEFKLKFLNHFYENDLKLKSLTTSIKHDDNDENEMSNLNEKMNYFVDLVNGLFAQKCSLENELEQVKNEYFKFLCLNKNLDEKGSEMIEAFNNENLVLNNLIFNISYNNDNKTRFFSEILISIAGLCSKMMNFKTLNQKKFSKAQNELQIVNKFNTDEKVFAKTPEDLLNQLDEIINISQFLNENKNEQSNIEVHYYVNEINRLVNFMQNSYSVVLQEEDSKSNDFSNQEMNTLDASNEYISRQKIKLRSKDLLNRQLKSKKKEKMFATLERLNE
jgi:ribosomal protein S15P/S13E